LSKDVYFPGYLGPLRLFEREHLEEWGSCQSVDPDDPATLLCSPDCGASRAGLAKRYEEVTSEAECWIAPSEERTLTRLFWPLRGAKVCYVLGYYLGTISLCGIVGEMVANLHFVMAEGTARAQLPPTLKDFEEERQSSRIVLLKRAGLLTQDVGDALGNIRDMRNRYLHAFQADYGSMAEDARACFAWANAVVRDAVGQEADAGKVLLRPAFRAYLQRLGLLREKVWTVP
jgi:hypothetical protein